MILSVTMITKNEEDNLYRSLKEIKQYADEIIVIDTGSTDNTIVIAKNHGAKVKLIEWKSNFSAARNEAIKRASGEWILVLDADEVLKAKDGIKMKDYLREKTNSKIDGFVVTICNFIEPNNIISAEKNKSLRIFKNNKKIKYIGRIHEQVINCSRISEIPFTIYHYGYLKSEINRKNKHKRNRDLLINSLKEDPNNKYYVYHLAINNYSSENYDEAIEIVKKLIPLFDGSEAYAPRAYKCLIMSYKQKQNYDDMLIVADKAIEKWPKYTDLYYMKAISFYKKCEYKNAINQLEKCLELGEAVEFDSHIGVGSTRALMFMSNIFVEIGCIKKAIIKLTELIKIEPTNLSIYIRYCDLLLNLNKVDIVKKLLINYSRKYEHLANQVIGQLYIKRRFNMVIYLYENLSLVNNDLTLKYSLSCAYTQRYKVAIENLIKISSKADKEISNTITRNTYYSLWSLQKVNEAYQVANKYSIKSSNDLLSKVFYFYVNELNNNEYNINNLTDVFSVEQIKMAILQIIKELEPYKGNEHISCLIPHFRYFNIGVCDLISIYDERDIPNCLVSIYLNDKNIPIKYRYKRFISLTQSRTQMLYDFLIEDGMQLLNNGMKCIKVYSKLAECYEAKANKLSNNYYLKISQDLLLAGLKIFPESEELLNILNGRKA